MADKSTWKKLEEAKANLLKRAEALKQAFIQMPGGAQAGDPAAGGAPVDPAAGGAPMDPAMAGGAPMDPAMAGGAPMDPAMAGMDPAAMGMPPMGVDPATAGMLGGMPPPADPAAAAAGALAGGAAAGTPEPTLTLTLSQLWDVVTKVLGLAKKIGANGQGVAPEAAPAPSGVNQDAIKAAVIEALGDMGAMKTANAVVQAQNSASRAAMKAEILPHMNALMKGAKQGETRKFSPALQKMVDKYLAAGGKIDDLKPTAVADIA